MKQYSVAEAKDRLPALLHEVEASGPIELTRRGRPIAVVISSAQFERLGISREGFWARYSLWREKFDPEREGIDEEEIDGWRDRTTGREPVE